MKWLFIIVCLAGLGFAALYFHSDLTTKEIWMFLAIALAMAIVGGAPALALPNRGRLRRDDDSISDGIKLLFWGIISVVCMFIFIFDVIKFLDWRDEMKAKARSNQSVQRTSHPR